MGARAAMGSQPRRKRAGRMEVNASIVAWAGAGGPMALSKTAMMGAAIFEGRAHSLDRRGADGGRGQRHGLGKRGWPCGLAEAGHGGRGRARGLGGGMGTLLLTRIERGGEERCRGITDILPLFSLIECKK